MPSPLSIKLLQYEEAPPQAAWQYIAHALTESSDQRPVADKMQDCEIQPPAAAWINIATELNKNRVVAPVQKTRRLTILYRFSAAAITIGVVCIAGFYLFTKNAGRPMLVNPVASTIPNSSPKVKARVPNNQVKSFPSKSLAILRKASAVLSRKRQKKFLQDETKILRNAVVDNMLFADTLLSIMVNTKLIRNEKGAVIQNLSLLSDDDPYINITSPNGEPTKISAKFQHALLYLRDNNYLDNFNGSIDKSFIESLIWKVRFESWRKKLLHSPIVPLSSNYLDIFEFKELITREE